MAEDSTTAVAPAPPAPVSLFYSYAHEDEDLRDELQRHLKILQLRGLIAPWHDRAILPGQAWDQAIHRELQRAELVLLLLSVDFLSSDYILGVELQTALRRARDGSATVVPILLRPLDLDALDGGPLPMAQLMQRQGLPRDLKAVNTWRPRDAAWVSVSKGLRATVADIQARRAAAAPAGLQGTAPAPLRAGAAPDVALFGTAALADAPHDDSLLDDVLASASAGIAAAQQARSSPMPDAPALRRQTMALLGANHQPRLLWVDDQPDNNLHEADMLARLQIEVVQVRSTDAALALLRHDREGFDLVVSDWHRASEAPDAGLRLQQAMRSLGFLQPVVLYHGSFDSARRQLRAAQAQRAGVFGEAVVPIELLGLVQAALARSGGPD